jgi:hypothetical protein
LMFHFVVETEILMSVGHCCLFDQDRK